MLVLKTDYSIPGRILAARLLGPTEEYYWLPNKTAADIKIIEKEIETKNPNKYFTCSYCIDENHVWDFERWKDALVNKTQTFKKAGNYRDFVFYENNINKLNAKGFILMVRASIV